MLAEFLRSHESELRRLRDYPGVETIEGSLMFAFTEDTAAVLVHLEPDLVRLAGSLGMRLAVKVVATSTEESK